jgi:hypothetical protein
VYRGISKTNNSTLCPKLLALPKSKTKRKQKKRKSKEKESKRKENKTKKKTTLFIPQKN